MAGLKPLVMTTGLCFRRWKQTDWVFAMHDDLNFAKTAVSAFHGILQSGYGDAQV